MKIFNRARKVMSFLFVLSSLLVIASGADANLTIDHTCTDIAQIPSAYISAVKNMNVIYTGESHGRQIPYGLQLLESQNSTYNATVYGGGVGLTESAGFDVSRALRLYSGMAYWGSTTVDIADFWSTTTGMNNVRRTLDYYADNGITIDAIVHTWCWDLRTFSVSQVNSYLSAMETLESEYPAVTFVYMTDTEDDSSNNAEDYNRWIRNEQIRDYCEANGKVLFDFGGLETYGTDHVLNTFYYNGYNVPVWDPDWSINCCYTTPEGTTHINAAGCIMKAKAMWWLMARLAGWNPGSPSTTTSQPASSTTTSQPSSSTTTSTVNPSTTTTTINSSSTTTVHYGEDVCNDGIDNDDDGNTDCDDADCYDDLACNVVTTYEDAEDGLTTGWTVYDSLPLGAKIENVYDADRGSRVVRFTGAGTSNGYRLRSAEGSPWYNTSQTVLEWSMKYAEYFVVYIDLTTTAGHRYLTYRPLDYSALGNAEYVFYGLGTDAIDGTWHTFMRDLQADLEEAQPGVTILEVNGFLIRGSGMVDDIRMLDTVNLPAETLCFDSVDNDGDGLTDCSDLDCEGALDGQSICGVGECTGNTGRLSCQDGGLIDTCDPLEGASLEVCDDGLDNDCDGSTDCYDPDCSGESFCSVTVYEDAEDGLVTGWTVYDDDPAGATIENVPDADRGSRVIRLTGTRTDNGYRLRSADGSPWYNTSQTVFEWSMKYAESFVVYIDLMTTAGHRYLTYRPLDYDQLGSGEYVEYGLGTDAVDGTWHTFVRDLQADLNAAQAGVTLLEVNGIMLRGSGMVDDIRMIGEFDLPAETFCSDGDDNDGDGFTDCADSDCGSDPFCDATIYEDAEDGAISRWVIYDSDPAGARITNGYDNQWESRVISLTGAGVSNGYRLRNDDRSLWHNTSQVVLAWSMKYAESFVLYIDLMTTAGHRYLTYRPRDYDQLGSGEYVEYGLGTDVIDGTWHTFVCDLQADLEDAQPGVIINEVNGFLIRGSGMVDDIKMLDEMP